MLKKIVLISGLLISLFYLLSYNHQNWQDNHLDISKVSEKDFAQLDAITRFQQFIDQVPFIAVVHAKQSLTYPNSILHRYLLQNPVETTDYRVKAHVHKIIKNSTSLASQQHIQYSSAMTGVESHLVLVALCQAGDEFYAPDNGFEIPATQELLHYLTTLDLSSLEHRPATQCPADNN